MEVLEMTLDEVIFSIDRQLREKGEVKMGLKGGARVLELLTRAKDTDSQLKNLLEERQRGLFIKRNGLPRGVSYRADNGRYIACGQIGKKRTTLYTGKSKEKAIAARLVWEQTQQARVEETETA